MNKIAIFASGSGSNAQCIAQYFEKHKNIVVSLIISNNPNAYVLERAKNLGIPACVMNKQQFSQNDVLDVLKQYEIDFIVLAGFLLLVPQNLISAFPNRIINIHPALLPAHGGKGMYGIHVHKAVVESKKGESGITIHYVNSEFDRGEIIFQAKCKINENDTAEDVAEKVHKLEHEHYPKVIEQILNQL